MTPESNLIYLLIIEFYNHKIDKIKVAVADLGF